jgi:hypothetical protein
MCDVIAVAAGRVRHLNRKMSESSRYTGRRVSPHGGRACAEQLGHTRGPSAE